MEYTSLRNKEISITVKKAQSEVTNITTIDEIIEELKSENGYYANNGMTDVAEFNTKIIYCLEELKGLRTNIFGYIEFNKNLAYNMAINDFVLTCEKQLIEIYKQRYIDMRDIRKIAEQLIKE